MSVLCHWVTSRFIFLCKIFRPGSSPFAGDQKSLPHSLLCRGFLPFFQYVIKYFSFLQEQFKKVSLSLSGRHIYLRAILGGFTLERAILGKRIRESRISRGFTQQELADRAQIGVVYLSEIERGIKMPSMNIFVKLIDALEVSADYVLRDELPSGKEFICTEITEKLLVLTPGQRNAAAAILDAYINTLV